MNISHELYIGLPGALYPYRCREFTRTTAPDIVSRFSTGQPGESDLDLLKSESVVNFSGGMFQRTHKDNTKVARALGVYDAFSETLDAGYTSSAIVANIATIRAKYEGYYGLSMYRAFMGVSASAGGDNTNSLFDANFDSIALPAAVASGPNGSTGWISDIHVHKDYLFLALASDMGSMTSRRYSLTAETWVTIGGTVTHYATLRGTLYAIGTASQIYVVTNELTGTATYTEVTTAGSTDLFSVRDFIEFNGALWIAKDDGIFRFDGVTAVKVLPHRTAEIQVYNGAMYFYTSDWLDAGSWLYRFDGTNIIRLMKLPAGESLTSMSADSDYLYFSTMVTSGYVEPDKGSIGAVSTGINRVYSYDGQAFMLLWESGEDFNGTSHALFSIVGLRYARHETNDEEVLSLAVSTSIDVTTSEHDAGFPNIHKSLEVIEVDYQDIHANDSIVVTFSYHDGTDWSAWKTAGTITSATLNRLEITTDADKLYKRLKINVTATKDAASSLKLRSISWRYTLQPRQRYQWLAMLAAIGNSHNKDLNENFITEDSNYLSTLLDGFISRKTPIYMTSPDYGLIKTTVNAAALTFNIAGRFPINDFSAWGEYSLITVKNSNGVWEIMRVSAAEYSSGDDHTAITVLERGYLSITAGTLSVDAECRPVFRSYITALRRENTLLDDDTYNEQLTTGESQLLREYLLEVTEV